MTDILDRITPNRRPSARVAGTQRWRELLFLHWTVPVSVLRGLVPAPLAIDTWNEQAYVGLVPFAMRGIRSSWMPRRAGLDFLEANVRTYVHQGGVPGVYFFSLEASSWLAVQVARAGWGLPYVHADMQRTRSGARLTYTSRRRGVPDADLSVACDLGEALGPSAPGTLEYFLLERYVLFSFSRSGRLMRGNVFHTPYAAQRASVSGLTQRLVSSAGIPIGPTQVPEAIHYAEGVDVEVFGPWPV